MRRLAWLARSMPALALSGCVVAPDSGPPPPVAYTPPGPQIVNSASGECLDVQGGGAADGTPVILFHCHGSPNQTWTIANSQIIGLGGSCLDVQGGAPVNGASVIISHCDGRPSQRWTVANGAIVGIGGKCIDVLGEGLYDRTPVILTPCAGAPGQQWSGP